MELVVDAQADTPYARVLREHMGACSTIVTGRSTTTTSRR